MTPSSSSRCAGSALALAAAFAAVSASAATIPYTNSFTASGLPNQSGFTLNTTAGTLAASTSALQGTLTSYATDQFSNATNASYVVSSQFTITAYGVANGDQAVGLGVFGMDAGFTGTSTATRWVQASWVFNASTTANNGLLRLIEVNGSTATNVTLATGTFDLNGGTVGGVNVGATLTLRLTVTNTSANTYDLTLDLLNAAGTNPPLGSVSATSYVATAAPTGGYYIGLRDRIPNFSGTTTITHNDLLITAIPEPSSFAALAGLGALGFVASRRRRA